MGKRADGEIPFVGRLDGLLGELYENVPEALKAFDADAVHDARVATRRLKAAVDLLEPVLSDGRRKPFAKVLRKLRRRLGPLRDADVMVDHLGGLAAQGTNAAAAHWLRDRLIESRERARARSGKKAGPADVLAKLGTWWGVREEALEAREAIDSLLAESLHLQLDAFAERAALVAAVQQAGDEPPSARREDPHELRIAGKLLRYTLELAEAQGHALPPAVMKVFKKMQEALGDWHDYVVLVECAMRTSLDARLSYHEPRMQEELLDLARTLLRGAIRDLETFGKLWRQSGEEVSRTIREKFPLTRPAEDPVAPGAPAPPVNEPRTGPDPSGSGEPPDPAASPPDAASNA